MPTHATVKAFCNEHPRPICDLYAGLLGRAEETRREYDAQGIAALMGADGDPIEDGSGEDGDGRPLIPDRSWSQRIAP